MRLTTPSLAAAVLRMVFAQISVLTQIQQRPELSTFFIYINASKTFPTLLNSIKNFTLLAPSNNAFNTFRQSPVALQPGDDRMDALLMYHTLRGLLPTITFTPIQTFYPSYLTNATFSNVTDGQAVGLATSGAGPFLISGNKAQTTIATKDVLAKTGLIHIIDDVLTLPMNLVDAITQANLNVLAAILSTGGFLDPTKVVGQVVFGKDNTVFAPNVKSALTDFTADTQTRTKSQIDDIFNYHYVPGFSGYSSNLKDGQNLTTAAGTQLHVRVVGGTIFINGARIITSNLLTANGVLHTIDTLLDPLNITTPSPEQIAAANSSSPSNRKPNASIPVTPAAIVGISIGGIILLCSIATLIWLYLQQREERHRRAQPTNGHSHGREIFGAGVSRGVGNGGGAGVSKSHISRLRADVKELDSSSSASRPQTQDSGTITTMTMAAMNVPAHQTYYHSTDEGTVLPPSSRDRLPSYGFGKSYGEMDSADEEKRRLGLAEGVGIGVGVGVSVGVGVGDIFVSPVEEVQREPYELDAGPIPVQDPEIVKLRPRIEKTAEVEVTSENM